MLRLTATSLSSALYAHKATPEQYDIMVLDLQGGELLALQGAGAFLDAAEFLEVEISRKPYYAGGALAEDVPGFLAMHGFAPLWNRHTKADRVGRPHLATVRRRVRTS